jgi:hypothetical protein
MSLEAELQGIIRENEDDLLGFARKLYEHGYRQGLASRPQGSELPQTPAILKVEEPPVPQQPVPLFPVRSVAAEIQPGDVPEEPAEEEEPETEPENETCDHRVRGSITMAGLQKKIERLFDLSRFDIEVVICRRGDPERRKLKGSVKLKTYQRESE